MLTCQRVTEATSDEVNDASQTRRLQKDATAHKSLARDLHTTSWA